MSLRLVRGARVVVATHNPGKLVEVEALLAPYGLALVSAGQLGLPEPEETGASFAENARLKACAAARLAGRPALADDSGFCVAALGGAPGIYSARWAGPEKDFAAAMARVHREMGAAADRRAWFVSVLSLATPDGASWEFEGRIDGSMVWPPRGDKGFGYDPIFVPDGCGLTFGEMEESKKNAISHRARAFRRFREACL